MLATGSDDKTIRLWALPSGRPHPIPLIGHHNYIYSLSFSPKGNILVSGSFDEAVYLWDVRSARIMRTLPAHSDPVRGVDFNRDGTLLVSCSSDGLIRIWDTMTGQCLRTLVHEDRRQVSSVRFSPNSRYIVAWTLDERIRLWDYGLGKCVKTYQGHSNKSYSLTGTVAAYEPSASSGPSGTDHAFLLSGSEDGSIWAWDVESKDILWTSGAGVHTGPIFEVEVMRWNHDDPDEHGNILMISAGEDRKIRLWRGKVEKDKRKTHSGVNGIGPTGLNEETIVGGLTGIDGVNGLKDTENDDDDDDDDESDDDEESDEEEDSSDEEPNQEPEGPNTQTVPHRSANQTDRPQVENEDEPQDQDQPMLDVTTEPEPGPEPTNQTEDHDAFLDQVEEAL
ncbi:putative wd repeat protein [Phaeomoniella chlamydospora]|uniref:Mitochondrial division protein 1 n=1 Tax=Phaeomoniella chlamydospora TaxID=158046 RepID=A0A0G2E371_PHACM|nr:putative wd repeat protein [Phaeomoniella chlamydospora]